MSLIELVKFEPDNQTHVDELSRQRVVIRLSTFSSWFRVRPASNSSWLPFLQLCGWGLESVDTWREKVRKGVKVDPLSLSSPSSP
jgi:hypothetical protein